MKERKRVARRGTRYQQLGVLDRPYRRKRETRAPKLVHSSKSHPTDRRLTRPPPPIPAAPQSAKPKYADHPIIKPCPQPPNQTPRQTADSNDTASPMTQRTAKKRTHPSTTTTHTTNEEASPAIRPPLRHPATQTIRKTVSCKI